MDGKEFNESLRKVLSRIREIDDQSAIISSAVLMPEQFENKFPSISGPVSIALREI